MSRWTPDPETPLVIVLLSVQLSNQVEGEMHVSMLAERAIAESRRLRSLGVPRVGLILLGDEFGLFPWSAYTAFDFTLRVGHWDAALDAWIKEDRAHRPVVEWLPLGPGAASCGWAMRDRPLERQKPSPTPLLLQAAGTSRRAPTTQAASHM